MINSKIKIILRTLACLSVYLALGLGLLSSNAYATTVVNKTKSVTKTSTTNITVNDNLLAPDQSIFPLSRYSMYNSLGASIHPNAANDTIINNQTASIYHPSSMPTFPTKPTLR